MVANQTRTVGKQASGVHPIEVLFCLLLIYLWENLIQLWLQEL